jgi:hypothetical protein
MPSNTTFAPRTQEEFNSGALNYAGTGATATIVANATTNIDIVLSDDMIITGLELVVTAPQAGDYMTLHIIHPIAGEVNQFGYSWYMGTESFRANYQVRYPAKIYAGMTLRAKYVSVTAIAPTFVAVNYFLHKVLF